MLQPGNLLDPTRRLKTPLGIKGDKSTVIITNNPSSIEPNQMLTIRFPNLGPDDVIVPGTSRLSFKITLDSVTDANRTIVNNLGRAIVKRLVIKLDGREVQSIDDADVLFCYTDLWLSTNERDDLVGQGIQTPNVAKLRVKAGDASEAKKKEVALAATFKNRFYVPLDFELLHSHLPFHQSSFNDGLSYEIYFNDYSEVIISSDTNAVYTITDISLEYEIVTHPELCRQIRNQHERLAIYFDRIVRYRQFNKSKKDALWNINMNTPARSFKGILMLFTDQPRFGRDTEDFLNPDITKVTCIIEGKPNQIFANGMLPFHQFEEIRKILGGGYLRTDLADQVSTDFHLHDTRLDQYLTNRYALWLDFRTIPTNALHGSGRRIDSGTEGITLQIDRDPKGSGDITVYMYVVMDAQLNIENGRLKDLVY